MKGQCIHVWTGWEILDLGHQISFSPRYDPDLDFNRFQMTEDVNWIENNILSISDFFNIYLAIKFVWRCPSLSVKVPPTIWLEPKNGEKFTFSSIKMHCSWKQTCLTFPSCRSIHGLNWVTFCWSSAILRFEPTGHFMYFSYNINKNQFCSWL